MDPVTVVVASWSGAVLVMVPARSMGDPPTFSTWVPVTDAV